MTILCSMLHATRVNMLYFASCTMLQICNVAFGCPQSATKYFDFLINYVTSHSKRPDFSPKEKFLGETKKSIKEWRNENDTVLT